jgi:hypothetical protein
MDDPQQIVSCPACQLALISRLPLWKHVSTGRRWSDGYLETALLADANWRRLVACPKCNFIEHRRAFQTIEGTAQEELITNLPVNVYFHWFDLQTDLDPDIELSLRVEAWRVGNHERRQKIIRGPQIELEPPAEYTDGEKHNMQSILKLISHDNSPAKHLMRAELYRQLEDWKSAQIAARSLKGHSLEKFAIEIYRFTLERSPWPEPLRSDRVSMPNLVS